MLQGAMRVGWGFAADEDDDYDDGLDAAYAADSPPPHAHQDAKGKMEARGHMPASSSLCPRGPRTYLRAIALPLGQTRARFEVLTCASVCLRAPAFSGARLGSTMEVRLSVAPNEDDDDDDDDGKDGDDDDDDDDC